ncbi:MAG TPA: chemotaxis response regulator protein-glutamate methylesterase [Candidatus Dormibacteraeota bacterium]|nr:chemotaxis response regulator protein-glutamate methylesterase [Candidatus Dormibacteraeota bacterium]
MRIAIVNDVMMAVEAVRRVLAAAGGHQLAWVALDGEEAVRRCAEDTPDLILMDLIMPRMDGVEATRQIMAKSPCAIVIVTANVSDNTSKVFEAMGAGALDAVNTPVLEHPGAQDGAQALLAKIETIRKLIGAPSGARPSQPERSVNGVNDLSGTLVAIGASAGGPAALATVLGALPADFSSPIVVVQHVDEQFAKGLAEWLDGQTALKVRLAHHGERPVPGIVLLAGMDKHLVFSAPRQLAYTPEPVDCSYRPSIDAFFKSIEKFWPGEVIGIVLTGMGRDGAEGLRALREKGHHTIAQDRASSAVYGMPKAAAEIDAAAEILPLDKIGPRITSMLAQKRKTNV